MYTTYKARYHGGSASWEQQVNLDALVFSKSRGSTAVELVICTWHLGSTLMSMSTAQGLLVRGGSRCAQVLRYREQGAIGSQPTRVTVHKSSDTCDAAKSVHPTKGAQHEEI